MSREYGEVITFDPEELGWLEPVIWDTRVATKEDSDVEIEEEDDGQLAWLLPRGANPVVNGVRCTCGVAVSVKDAVSAMHSDWCDLKKGDDSVPNNFKYKRD